MSDIERQEVVRVARRLLAERLSLGTSGNVSMRGIRGMWITPTGIPFDELAPADIVEVSHQGEVLGSGTPSSEWRIHHDVYGARQDVGGIVHAHPPDATAVACLRWEIPAIHYMIAVTGGDAIKCAQYATFGSAELSVHVLRALGSQNACLMENHGVLAAGSTPQKALDVAREVEWLAGLLLRTRAVGQPALLTSAQMQEVMRRFQAYGKRSTSD